MMHIDKFFRKETHAGQIQLDSIAQRKEHFLEESHPFTDLTWGQNDVSNGMLDEKLSVDLPVAKKHQRKA